MTKSYKIEVTRGDDKILKKDIAINKKKEVEEKKLKVNLIRRVDTNEKNILIENENIQYNNLYFTDKKNVKLEDLFKFIIFKEKIRILNNSMYIYNEDLGYFEYIEENKELIEINKFISGEIRAKISPRLLLDIVKKLKSEPTIQISNDDINRDKNYINCRNGIIKLDTLELMKHDKKYLFTYCIKANFILNKDEIKAPNFEEFIDTSLEKDREKRKLLLEIIGYLCSNYNEAKRSVIFLGKPHSGKSLLSKLIARLIGEKEVSNIPLHKLGDRFSIAEFSNHRININAEISSCKLNNIDVFKSIVGGDYLTGEYKGQSPFSFKCRIKLLFCGNFMPIVKDLEVGDAFTDRLVFLLFNVSIPEEKRNYNLENLLMEEIDSIFTLSVYELKELVKKNFEFQKVSDSQQFIKFYKNENNHIDEFIKEKCTLGKDCKVHSKDIYSEYISFCDENCIEAYKQNKFLAFLGNVPNIEKGRFRIAGKNSRGFIGISIKK
ncbi:phage/plasmid primase, P4 family [Clostridioides difficile]|nr:phage/plasmid primase, P4 family [Clostridioides difficile]